MYQRRTHNRSQRFGGHARRAHYCICGKVVYGNGGTNHFYTAGGREYGERREGHKRISREQWEVLAADSGEAG